MQRNAQGEVFVDRDGEVCSLGLPSLSDGLGISESSKAPNTFCLAFTWGPVAPGSEEEVLFHDLSELADLASAGLLKHTMKYLAHSARSKLMVSVESSHDNSHAARLQVGERPMQFEAEDNCLEMLDQIGGPRCVIAALSSLSLCTRQMAAGALWFLTSKDCSHIQTQPEEVQPANCPLMTGMSSEHRKLQENATAASTPTTQQHAAKAIAALVKDANCAAIALQSKNLKLILQLFEAASSVLWDSILEIVAVLTMMEDTRQQLAASEALYASVMESMLYETVPCHPSGLDRKQAAADFILQMCHQQSFQQKVISFGGIKPLSKMLDSPSTEV
ncbi:hypothetical protein WJX74_005188 [Apatococcus lobatus]|uniref:Uncharacterized protein n=1 Tax=Apatococcus lobatus TaxID=904363 RepID=A0AAW1RLS2_9CHLO